MNIESKIQQNINLKNISTFKIGGDAEFFLEINTKEDLREAYDWAQKNKTEVTVLAGASNVLICDKGVKGLVIKMNNKDFQIKGERIEAGAGADFNKLVRISAGDKLSGLEWGIGIPGTVGGAVRGNAGAYGSSISDIVENIEVFNTKKKRFEFFSNKDCRFAYRESIFKISNYYLIWQVTLKLNSTIINKQDLVQEYLKKRDVSQPKLPSAGCVFKNFNINYIRGKNKELADEAAKKGLVKNDMLGAGWLIDLLGFKGRSVGGAKVSLEHANFIVNTSNARATDVVSLIKSIQNEGKLRFNIDFDIEIQLLGF